MNHRTGKNFRSSKKIGHCPHFRPPDCQRFLRGCCCWCGVLWVSLVLLASLLDIASCWCCCPWSSCSLRCRGWPYHWGRRLEGWSNRAARLAGWRRVTLTACLYRTVPFALAGSDQLQADGSSSCCYVVKVHNYELSIMSYWAMSREEGVATE
jgi:hypothetical protein